MKRCFSLKNNEKEVEELAIFRQIKDLNVAKKGFQKILKTVLFCRCI